MFPYHDLHTTQIHPLIFISPFLTTHPTLQTFRANTLSPHPRWHHPPSHESVNSCCIITNKPNCQLDPQAKPTNTVKQLSWLLLVSKNPLNDASRGWLESSCITLTQFPCSEALTVCSCLYRNYVDDTSGIIETMETKWRMHRWRSMMSFLQP